MAYYSKYSGKEVDERLDRVDSIPTKISQLLNDKDYITEIELKAILDKIPIVDFSKIPIDEDTIYWSENSDGKLVLKSKGGGEDSNWSVKKDSNGNKYIYTELPVVTQYGVTMYGNSGDINLPSLYAGLPIDNQTIYWDNGVLKSLGGGGEGLDEEALRNYLLVNEYVTKDELPSLNGYATESWVLNLGYIGPEGLKNYVDISSNQDINGKKNFKSGISINGLDIYQSQDDVIYLDANLVVRGGITMFANGGNVDIPSIAQGLPFDGQTIWYNPDTQQIEVIGGTGGGSGEGVSNFWDLSDIPSWITNSKPKYTYTEIENTPDLSVYALASDLAKYATLAGDETITGLKNFAKGLQIGGLPITKSQDDVIYLDANLVVRGGITMYAEGEVNIPSIIDSLPIASTTAKGIASFDGTYFAVDSNGKVTLLAANVGLNEEELAAYLTENKYATQSWVYSLGYASSSDLNALQTKVNDFLEGSDTDTIINKWKELEVFLSGLSESDNLAEILETKANKSYVDSTFITIAGSEDVTGIHDFKNGLKVGGMKLSKSQDDVVYLDGNLVVRGGLTMYALDDVTVDSIIDKLPTASTNSKGVASFDEDDFTIEDGHVSLNDERLSSELSELKDVEVLNPQNNESLVYNSETAKWENKVVDSDKTFYYEQQTSSDTWNINHNLSKKPSVMVFDSANDEVNGDIIYNDNNNITLRFSAPFSGIAILN